MKKIILGILLSIILLLTIGSTVLAAPPTYEEWECASYDGGLVQITYEINTTNLKTTHFTIYNNSDYAVALRIRYDLETVYEVIGEPHTTTQYDYVLNFQRIPQNDPDDPNSVRYPNKYSLGGRYPAY